LKKRSAIADLFFCIGLARRASDANKQSLRLRQDSGNEPTPREQRERAGKVSWRNPVNTTLGQYCPTLFFPERDAPAETPRAFLCFSVFSFPLSVFLPNCDAPPEPLDSVCVSPCSPFPPSLCPDSFPLHKNPLAAVVQINYRRETHWPKINTSPAQLPRREGVVLSFRKSNHSGPSNQRGMRTRNSWQRL